MRTARRLGLTLLAATCGSLAIAQFASEMTSATASPPTSLPGAPPPVAGDPARGRSLFVEGCSSCHGLDARGVANRGPSLRGVGAGAVDFYVRTGRMPLAAPGMQPLRAPSRYSNAETEDLEAYIGKFGGPGVPQVDPSAGSVRDGLSLFASSCAGCHAISGAGGVVPGAYTPALGEATPTQVGEALRLGPYLMPRFSRRQITPADVNSIARYVALTQDPVDQGGWGIGHIGPVPEGLVAWALAAVALLAIARLIGERT